LGTAQRARRRRRGIPTPLQAQFVFECLQQLAQLITHGTPVDVAI